MFGTYGDLIGLVINEFPNTRTENHVRKSEDDLLVPAVLICREDGDDLLIVDTTPIVVAITEPERRETGVWNGLLEGRITNTWYFRVEYTW